LLVIVMISNAVGSLPGTDTNPETDTSGWYDAIVDAKGGHPENAVLIGFLPHGDTFCIPNGYDGYQDENIVGLIEQFGENGVVANVCLEDYGPTFTDSLEVVLDACGNFIPG
jgi:hypothetical protein